MYTGYDFSGWKKNNLSMTPEEDDSTEEKGGEKKYPFKLVPVSQVIEIPDKFIRNEIMFSNNL